MDPVAARRPAARQVGQAQPAHLRVLDQDRSQITGPDENSQDAVIRTVVDLGGSLGVLGSLIKEVKGFDGVFKAPKLGVDFEPPWAILVAPDGGNDGSVISAGSPTTPPGLAAHRRRTIAQVGQCPQVNHRGGTG